MFPLAPIHFSFSLPHFRSAILLSLNISIFFLCILLDRKTPTSRIHMDSSTFSGNNRGYLQYVNKFCHCGRNAEIKISCIQQNPYRLFYTCRNRFFTFFSWCNPATPDAVDSLVIEDEAQTENNHLFPATAEPNHTDMRLKAVEDKVFLLWPLTLAMSFLVAFYFLSSTT